LSLSSLERALKEYLNSPMEQTFDLKTVPIETTPVNTTSALQEMFEPVERKLLFGPITLVCSSHAFPHYSGTFVHPNSLHRNATC
jgi:hypothetical protein